MVAGHSMLCSYEDPTLKRCSRRRNAAVRTRPLHERGAGSDCYCFRMKRDGFFSSSS